MYSQYDLSGTKVVGWRTKLGLLGLVFLVLLKTAKIQSQSQSQESNPHLSKSGTKWGSFLIGVGLDRLIQPPGPISGLGSGEKTVAQITPLLAQLNANQVPVCELRGIRYL